jgi:NarL family two-component system response regulator LiaR
MTIITVLVVDDHDLLREGVSACLASFPDVDVVGEVPNGEAAVEAAIDLGPDVVVIDIVMPGIGGIEAIRQLRSQDTTVGIVALSSFSDPARVRDAIDAGANSYLVKSVGAESLAAAVRDAAAGQSTFSPEVTQALIARDEESSAVVLTPREREVGDLLANGRTNAEMAHQLELSIFTVKNHVSSILMKLNVQSRTEAASVILRSSRLN